MTSADDAHALRLISLARAYLARQMPYLAPVLYALVPRVAPGLGTVAVSLAGILRYDPLFLISVETAAGKSSDGRVSQAARNKLAGILAHECMHIVLQHHKRGEGLDPQAWNEAADRAINPGVERSPGLSLPSDVLRPRDIGQPDGLSAYDYYEEQKKHSTPGGSGHTCSGRCGGASGNPLPEEAGDSSDPSARSSGEMTQVARAAAEQMRAAAEKNQGSVPAGWLVEVNALLAPPKVDWRRELGAAIRSCVAYRPGATLHRYDAPSRRQGGIGYGGDRPILPRWRTAVPEVALAIDTSGSMYGADLEAAVTEARGVLNAVGARVRFLACDADVHADVMATSISDVVKNLKGGGGTDFRPVFAALEATGVRRPDVLVFVTDGRGTWPPEAPTWCRVIWVLVGKRPAHPPWGTCVEVSLCRPSLFSCKTRESRYSSFHQGLEPLRKGKPAMNQTSQLVVTPDSEVCGTIVWWRLSGRVQFTSFQEAWVAAGLSPELLPSMASNRVCLRRLANRLARPGEDVRSLDGGWAICTAATAEGEESTAEHVRARVRSAVKLHEGELFIRGETDPDTALALFREEQSSLASEDVSSWLTDWMTHLDAVRLRDTGGIYFVPRTRRSELEAGLGVFRATTSHVVSAVPAMSTAEAAAAFLDAMHLEAENAAKELADRLAQLDTNPAGPRHLTTRLRQLDATLLKLSRYEKLLGGQLDAARDTVVEAKARLSTVILTLQASETEAGEA